MIVYCFLRVLLCLYHEFSVFNRGVIVKVDTRLYLVAVDTASINSYLFHCSSIQTTATANELTMQPQPSDSNANQSVSKPTTVTPCENINKLPIYFKGTWVLLNVCLTAHPIITIIYWGFIYNPEFVYNNQGGAYGVALTVHRHALNTIFAYLDLFVSATPIKFWHFVHPCAYSLLYIAFSLVYFWAGGRNPYDGNPAIYTGILDWTTPARTIPILFGVILTLVMFHSIGYGCYRLRVYIGDRCLNAGDGHRRDSQVLHNQINIECNPIVWVFLYMCTTNVLSAFWYRHLLMICDADDVIKTGNVRCRTK